jgi:putative DNA primase/helicase
VSELSVNVDLEDDELLRKARNASNGAKFDRLWNGNTPGYDSHSEADMALGCLLAFWTGGNRSQMNQLFQQSGLLREKWDEVHYADGSTYGEKTIERAIATTSEFYDPNTGNGSTEITVTPATSGIETTRDGSTRNQAYLIEKNRLLADRVAKLEAELEEKENRIETLEAELAHLESMCPNEQSTTAPDTRELTASTLETDQPPNSVWTQMKSLLSGDAKRGSQSSAVYAPPRRLIRATTIRCSFLRNVTTRRNSPIRTFLCGLFCSGSP